MKCAGLPPETLQKGQPRTVGNEIMAFVRKIQDGATVKCVSVKINQTRRIDAAAMAHAESLGYKHTPNWRVLADKMKQRFSMW